MLGESHADVSSLRRVAAVACIAFVALLVAPLAMAKAVVRDLEPTGPQPQVALQDGGQLEPIYKASHALLISAATYAGASNGGWEPLPSTTREMDDLATALRGHGFAVRRVSDPSGEELRSEIRRFVAQNGRRVDHRLLIFFAGHGHTDRDTEVGYIVPVDALDPNRHSANFYEKAMPITELNTIALEIKARHALFLFDSCFSGSVFQSRSQTVPPTDRRQYLRDVQSEPVRQLIAAGRANEKVPGRSTFTPLLIDLLSGKRRASDDQYLTGSDIGRWLTQHLPSFVPDQHPHSGFVRGRWDLGDMVFQLRSTSPPPPPPPGNTPGQPLPRDCAACPDLVYVPPGDFVMGSPDGEKDRDSDEGPTHAVRITYALAVGRNEVSRGEFAQFVQAAGHKTDAESSGQGCSVWSGKEWAYDAALTWRKPGFDQTDDHPVVCVSWQDAQAYVAWLNDHHRGGKPYRLLSEAEWEYAARAGQGGKRFPWGDDEGYSVMCRYANAADQAAKKGVPGWATVADSSFAKCDDGFAYTAPAYTLTANAFGLHHMHGNVWEWVQDVYHDTYKGAPADGSAWESGGAARRVLRGGSWRDIPRNLRSANRDSVAPDIRNIDAGFRVARTF